MPRMRKVFDTSMLIWAWHRQRGHRPIAGVPESEARSWPDELTDLYATDAIVTPVRIEFLAGVRDAHELRLARAFMERFRTIDDGHVLAGDWAHAERLAERVPRDGRPRQLGDCLIRAIAARLRHDVLTRERHFPTP